MNLTAYINYALFSVSLAFFVTVFLYLIYYISQKISAGNDSGAEDAYEQAVGVINEAQVTAVNIIKNANYKALQTLENSSNFNTELKHEIKGSLEHLTHRHLESMDQLAKEMEATYKAAVLEQKDKNLHTLEEVSQSMKIEVVKEVAEFKEVLEKETIGSQQMVEEKIKEEYGKIMKELEEYKEQQLKEIEKSIFNIVSAASRKIIGQALELDRQEELVISCLDEAKKEGVFNK